jgi:type II secretory pathway pseudopilin PulG
MLSNCRRGVSLLELLVILAILAVLGSLILAGVQRARESAARTRCQNNLRQIALACLTYETTNNHLPPARTRFVPAPPGLVGPTTGYGHGLFTYVLPYLDQTATYRLVQTDRPFNHPDNLPPANPAFLTPIPAFVCPSAPAREAIYDSLVRPYFFNPEVRLAATDYGPVTGLGEGFVYSTGLAEPDPNRIGNVGLFAAPETGWVTIAADGTWSYRPTRSSCTDGLSNTLTILEDAGRPAFWERGKLVVVGSTIRAEGGAWGDPETEFTVDADRWPCVVNCHNDGEPYSFHRGGINAARTDGSVVFIRESVAAAVLVAGVTKAGGEPPPDE